MNMGIEVVIEDETGMKIRSLEDPTNVLHRVLPPSSSSDYEYLSKVDWYGDTIFNRYQIPAIQEELAPLATSL